MEDIPKQCPLVQQIISLIYMNVVKFSQRTSQGEDMRSSIMTKTCADKEKFNGAIDLRYQLC